MSGQRFMFWVAFAYMVISLRLCLTDGTDRTRCNCKNAQSKEYPAVIPDVQHLLFAIASSNSTWERRARYVRTWWDPDTFRGHVWFDRVPVERHARDPEYKQSSSTEHLHYDGTGKRRSLRMARLVVDAFRLNLPNVHWYVKGDDDTFFNPYGIAALLSKYNHNKLLYIGSPSESHGQNSLFSHDMAFGGGGFAISKALAAALNFTMDECLERHSDLWGSDQRVRLCAAELGVQLVRERGFHQCDVRGSVAGLLEAHVPEVFASLHHVEQLSPVLPSTQSRVEALQKLTKAVRPDPVGFLQQAVCYDQKSSNWTASISWGYSVKIYPKVIRLSVLERVERTFTTFDPGDDPVVYDFNTRDVWAMAPPNDFCGLPFAMCVKNVDRRGDGAVVSTYERCNDLGTAVDRSHCDVDIARIGTLHVIRMRPMQVPRSDNGLSQGPTLRRHCCQRVEFNASPDQIYSGTIWLHECRDGQAIRP